MTQKTIITGCPRSKTTLIAAMFQAHGANLGKAVCPKTLEHLGYRNNVVKPVIESFGYDGKCQDPLPDVPLLTDSYDVKCKIENELAGVDVVKCPKSIWLWPTIQELFPEWNWVIVTRDLEEIAESVVRSNIVKGIRNIEQARGWVARHQEALNELIETEFHVWDEQYVIEDMLDAFGYEPNSAKINEVRAKKWA